MFSLLFLLPSCYKKIDIDLDEGDQRLVVESWFTTEQKAHEVKLTLSTSYFENQVAPKVSGANVYITGGGDVFTFTETAPGIYTSAPDAGANYSTEYTLHIDYDGVSYAATDYCDTVPNLDDLMLYPDYDTETGELLGYAVLIWAQELEGFGDYYAWKVLINGEYRSDTLTDIFFASDDYIDDGLYFEAWAIEYIDINDVNSGDVVTLEQHQLSKQSFDLYNSIMSETEWRGGIFDAPPANVSSNVDNGAFGNFVVSSVKSMDVVVP